MAAPVSGSLLFFFYLSVFDAGVELCSLPAPADGGDFLNHIGKFQEPSRSPKQMPGKVCPQAVTQDRGVVTVYDIRQLIHLLFRQELCYVDNDGSIFPCLRVFMYDPVRTCISEKNSSTNMQCADSPTRERIIRSPSWVSIFGL